MLSILKYIWFFILVAILTIITQIGGIILVIAIVISHYLTYKLRFKTALIFLGLYLIATFFIVPHLAKINGREKIIYTNEVHPVNYMTVVLNRNYGRHELNQMLLSVSKDKNLVKSGIQIRYLDAGFPFFNGFPLLPHLSHNDGRKIDVSLVYQDKEGLIINESKSISGYGVFEEPFVNEFNQCKECMEQGYTQYDFPKYLTLGSINEELKFSVSGTKLVISAFLKQNELEKIFIEPHLKRRMNLNHSKIRFQGCRAVRHDDHIHLQIK